MARKTQTHRRTDAQTHRRTDAQTHRRTDAQARRDTRRRIDRGMSITGKQPWFLVTGRRRGRRYTLELDGVEVTLPDADFDVMCQLIAARLANCGAVCVSRVSVHRILKAIAAALPRRAAEAPFICPSPKGKGCYLLSWPRDRIRVDESFREAVLKSNAGTAAAQQLRKHMRYSRKKSAT